MNIQRIRFTAGLMLAASLMATGCGSPKPVEMPRGPEEAPITSSPGKEFYEMPQAAQDTVTAVAGASDIRQIIRMAGTEEEIYEVQFSNPGATPNLYVAADGSLVYNGVKRKKAVSSELPSAVRKVIQDQYADEKITDVKSHEHTIYEITFKDSAAHPKLYITETGDILMPKTP